MTGTLHLCVPIDPDAGWRTSGIVVRIAEKREEPDGARAWDVLVPTGPRGLPLEVPAGEYGVQALLPSGRIISRTSTIHDGELTRVELVDKRKLARPATRPDATAAWQTLPVIGWDPLEFQPAFSADGDPFLEQGPPPLVTIWSEQRPDKTWSVLAGVQDTDELAGSEEFRPNLPELNTQLATSLPHALPRRLRPFDLGPNDRHWVSIETSEGFDIGSIPMPWINHQGDKSSNSIDIDIIEKNNSLDINLIDDHLDSLLIYLKYGRMSTAGAALNNLQESKLIQRTLEAKRDNPLAACAAAYVGLAISSGEGDEPWRAWGPNLMNWFPWMPDGAIIHARILMDTPMTQDTQDSVLRAAKEAFRRGIPYFSAGLHHLREILFVFGSSDLEARDMLGAVRALSGKCDTKQPFTTFHL